jgi:hypothetical protein
MTQSIDPIRSVNGDRRARVRRATDAPAQAEPTAQLPVVVQPDKTPDPQPALAAHLIGQENQRRGLRGGPETLAKAQAAYLTAEWSGAIDRRTRRGVISKTKI